MCMQALAGRQRLSLAEDTPYVACGAFTCMQHALRSFACMR
jgi:hypothetical protein